VHLWLKYVDHVGTRHASSAKALIFCRFSDCFPFFPFQANIPETISNEEFRYSAKHASDRGAHLHHPWTAYDARQSFTMRPLFSGWSTWRSLNTMPMHNNILKNSQQMETDKHTHQLYSDICRLIEEARAFVASSANQTLTLLYWKIGNRIHSEMLDGKRATYGKQIVSQLAAQLQQQYGKRGFDEKNIRRMVQFAQVFPDEKIVVSLIRQLSWTHVIALIPIKDILKREFYSRMCQTEGWNVKTLRNKIDGMLYERTIISGKPEKVILEELNKLTADKPISPDLVFKSPYFLDFTGLKGMYSERSLEESLVTSLEQFIMELGHSFTFVERQKRMIIDGEDFYLDLLFFHRKLKQLIAIELKLGKFKAAYKGQMELYLRWLDKYERQEGEETPLGLILCAGGGHEQIELLQLDKAGIKVAEYLTELPDRRLLKEKLQLELDLKRKLFDNNE
jgi:predicted nuclease of restriction endonuclease-like (RecB) superfamily